MEEKSMTRNHGGGVIGRGIVEKESTVGFPPQPISNIGSLLDAMRNYLFIWEFQETIYKNEKETHSRPTASGFGDFSIDMFLEVQKVKTMVNYCI